MTTAVFLGSRRVHHTIDRRIIRAHRNGSVSNGVGWGTILLTIVLAALTVRQLVAEH